MLKTIFKRIIIKLMTVVLTIVGAGYLFKLALEGVLPQTHSVGIAQAPSGRASPPQPVALPALPVSTDTPSTYSVNLTATVSTEDIRTEVDLALTPCDASLSTRPVLGSSRLSANQELVRSATFCISTREGSAPSVSEETAGDWVNAKGESVDATGTYREVRFIDRHGVPRVIRPVAVRHCEDSACYGAVIIELDYADSKPFVSTQGADGTQIRLSLSN